MLNELGGLAEGRGPAAALQRTADAKATLHWIRSLRESRERHLGPPLKCACPHQYLLRTGTAMIVMRTCTVSELATAPMRSLWSWSADSVSPV